MFAPENQQGVNQDEFSVWDSASFQGSLYVSFRELKPVGFQQAVTKRQALEAPAWFGSRTFFWVHCVSKNHGDFEKTNAFGEFLEGDIPPQTN